jgi:hypothetical protein
MKVFGVLNVFIIIYLFLNCHGGPETIDYELLSSLYGSWMYADADSTKIIQNFSPPNNLEIHQYLRIGINSYDTTYIYCSYEIPASHLMYKKVDYQINLDSLNNVIYKDDTLIFYQDNQEIELYFNGRFYKQITGNNNQLLNSEFYRIQFIGNSYFHELYRFEKDSLHRYLSITGSSLFPKDWQYYHNHKYSSTNRQITWQDGSISIVLGYIFYQRSLILARSPHRYKKIK